MILSTSASCPTFSEASNPKLSAWSVVFPVAAATRAAIFAASALRLSNVLGQPLFTGRVQRLVIGPLPDLRGKIPDFSVVSTADRADTRSGRQGVKIQALGPGGNLPGRRIKRRFEGDPVGHSLKFKGFGIRPLIRCCTHGGRAGVARHRVRSCGRALKGFGRHISDVQPRIGCPHAIDELLPGHLFSTGRARSLNDLTVSG